MSLIHSLRLCTSFLACFWASASALDAADPLRPLRVVEAEHAESQVDENPNHQEPRWVIRHDSGLRVIGIKSGSLADVVVHPNQDFNINRGRLLTQDAGHFAYLSSDTGDLTVARTADGASIAKVEANKIFGRLGNPSGDGFWIPQTYLADDATQLWCMLPATRRIVRIELAPEPRIAASHELEGSRGASFNLFAGGSKPGFVTTTDYSPKGGWFRVFDGDLRLLYSKHKVPQCAAYCVIERPEPLILLDFPQTMTWQLLRQQGNAFKPVSSASYAAPRRERRALAESLMSAAISPDGKLLVTSQASQRPAISVWNTASGALLLQVELEGGGGYKLESASHHTIFRLAFSLSGKYLTASDAANAYLLEAADLTKGSTATKAE
jgi:hypothetical protein